MFQTFLYIAFVLGVPILMILKENKKYRARRQLEEQREEFVKKKPWYN